MTEQTSISPSRRQTALDLTCAIIASGFITAETLEDAATEAVQLLNAMEAQLKTVLTPHR